MDVVIDFSYLDIGFRYIEACLKANVLVVSGIIGWLYCFEEVKVFCLEKEGVFFYVFNFSIGVNFFFVFN